MSKTISFNLSTKAIMQEIYAISALRCLNNGSKRPAILTRDRAPALRLLIKDAFAFIIMKFISYVENCNLNDTVINDDEDMILSVDMRMSDEIADNVAHTMRITLEHAIAAYALHICYIGLEDDTSNQYNIVAQNEVDLMEQMLSASSFQLTNIIPRY